MDTAFVKKLKVQSPQDILRALVTQFENAGPNSSSYPFVTVTMGTFTFTGVPVKIDMVRTDNFIALFCPEKGLRGQDAVTFLPLNMISAVSVDNFREHLNALAAGMPPAGTGEAPTKLALERKLAEINTKTGKKIVFSNLETGADEGTRFYFAGLLQELELVILQLNMDAMGKEAIAEVGQFILRFAENDRLNVSKEGKDIKISIGYTQPLKQLNADLRDAIEKSL